MPSLTVPSHRRRRRRNEDPADEDEDESRSRHATRLSQSSTGSKRIRLSNPAAQSDDEVEDPTQDEEADPDDLDEDESDDNQGSSNSRQRGPPTTTSIAPKAQGLSGGDGEFQPGAIVRIKLKDFVTYTSAEFFPGPKLNMVIGPNGTGKSTLVCAICLGLGWGPQVIF
jgi:hypothetical protein